MLLYRQYLLLSFLILVQVQTANAVTEPFIPVTPDVQPYYQPNDNVEAGLWLQLDKTEQALKHSPKRINDKKLNNYVNEIICRLAEDYCQDIRVYIVRAPFFNAQMAPNGMMIIWSGLLLRVDNEDQLAAVIGHELGHYLKRHSLNNLIDRKNKRNLSAFLSIGLAALGVGPVASITDFILMASIFAHNREQESEADKYGIQLMREANYDIREASKVWDALIDEDKAAVGVPFFATHPPSEDRSKTLNLYAEQLRIIENPPTPPTHKQFVETVATFWSTFLDDQILLNQPKRTEYLLKTLISKEKLPGTIHYYNGELLRQRNEEGDIKLAENEYITAIQYDDAPYVTYRELGLVLLKQKRFQEAHTYFNNYLEYAPDANDREMIEFYLSMEQN